MTIDQKTVTIKVDAPGAAPAFGEGQTNVTFHLTRGYIVEGDTETFNDAINFTGKVNVTTTEKEFADWKFAFLQFQKVEFLGFFYAGPKKSAGQVTVLADRKPALDEAVHLDSEDEYSPYTHSFDASLKGGLVTAISGDHPASRAPKQITNRITSAFNYLFHAIDQRTFWTVFTAKAPDGKFTHLGHVKWALEYNFQFVWKDGKPASRINKSSLTKGSFVAGPPPDGEIAALLASPKPPHANPAVRAALKNAAIGGPPNRSDQGTVMFNNLPADFFT